MGGADTPVKAWRLGQIGGDDHARAVVHEALARELAHAGVHDRNPCAAFAPGLGERLVVAPTLAPRPVIGRGQVGPCGEHLVVEVPPAELPYVRLCSLRRVPGATALLTALLDP